MDAVAWACWPGGFGGRFGAKRWIVPPRGCPDMGSDTSGCLRHRPLLHHPLVNRLPRPSRSSLRHERDRTRQPELWFLDYHPGHTRFSVVSIDKKPLADYVSRGVRSWSQPSILTTPRTSSSRANGPGFGIQSLLGDDLQVDAAYQSQRIRLCTVRTRFACLHMDAVNLEPSIPSFELDSYSTDPPPTTL